MTKNNSIVKVYLGGKLCQIDKYTGAMSLSLDVSTPERQEILRRHELAETVELVPDLVLYNSAEFGLIHAWEGADKERVLDVPLLCVEIDAPEEGNTADVILKKFSVYFELGVKSCWYVNTTKTLVRVYEGGLLTGRDFIGGVLKDDMLGIEVSLEDFFRK